MKVYIDSRWQKVVEKSGVGRAMYHQKRALALQGIRCVETKEEADVIHINTIFPGSASLARWGRRHGKAVVFHAHSTREDFRNSFIGSNAMAGLFGKWIQYCYESGDCMITPTEYSKKLLQNYGIDKPIYAMSNGIDTEYYQRKETDEKEFREAYGYTKEDKIVMSAGLWIKRKGILDFVELAERMPQYQFIWFGESELCTLPAEIRQAVKKELPNLRFAGYVKKEELRKAYAACDLFLFPSYEETEGIVVLEALAMRIPTLLRDIPVYDGWLRDKQEVYKAGNMEEFQKTISGILEKHIPDLTERGYEAAKKRDIRKTGKELVQIYENALLQKLGQELIPEI